MKTSSPDAKTATHIHGTAAVEAHITTAIHVIREARSGYLALASDPERKLYMVSATPIFERLSDAMTALQAATSNLTVHERRIWQVDEPEG